MQYYSEILHIKALQIEVRYPIYLNAKQLDCSFISDWQVPEFDNAKHKFESIFEQITKTLVAV